MRFVKNLIGGVAIMIVATGVGVAQNAVRSDGVTLFPRISQPAKAPRVDPSNSDATTEKIAIDAGSIDPSPEVTPPEFETGRISMERVKVVIDAGTAIVIDARGEHEYDKGHLPGAINVPYDMFVEYQSVLDEQVPYDAPVIVYCTSVSCDLGEKLILELRLMDYQHIVLYPGGWDEWSEAGYPIEGSESTE